MSFILFFFYSGGGDYIKFGLKNGKTKDPDDEQTRKRKAQIYGQYKDPLKVQNHEYKKVRRIPRYLN